MIELLDELEAGELTIEFEGAEPQELLEWALERFAPRIALSTAFQVDGVALIDMASEIDPRSACSRSTRAGCPPRPTS